MRLIPSGVTSNAHAIMSAIGNPMAIVSTINLHHPIRNFKDWENLCRDLDEQPANDRVRDRNLVNVAPLQLGEEIVRVHRQCR